METLDYVKLIQEGFEYQKKALEAAKAFVELSKDEAQSDTLEKEVVFTLGKLKLYHYKPLVAKSKVAKIPLLVVYAQIQRYYMLDIQPDRSVLKAYLEAGLDIYLIDWGYPTAEDRYLTMDDFVNWYMDECVNFILEDSKCKKINLLGICQGGNFSICYTALHQDKINALVTEVVPFDFVTNDSLLFKWGKDLDIDAMVDAYGVIPVDILNFSFLILTPFYGSVGKYVDLFNNPRISDKAFLANFLRMERWVFDGPDQPGETIRQFVNDMYKGNKLSKGELVLGGKKVDVGNITCPLLNVMGSADNLVPNTASKPLNDKVSSEEKETLVFPVGHIGMFTGHRSYKEIAPQVAEWLIKHSNTKKK